MVLSVAGCNGNDNTEESSIAEAPGGITGDINISDVSVVNDEDEAERQARLQAQSYDIVNSNTKYSDRFMIFRDKVLNKDCTMTFKKIEKGNNGDYTYKYVNRGKDWYYSMVITDIDNGGKKSEYEYFEKDGIGYSFDYDSKTIIKISKDRIVKQRIDVLPILSGISIKKQTTDNFMGNRYSCDVYSYVTAEYDDSFNNIVKDEAGTVKIFYNKDEAVVGISVILKDGVTGYDIQITGFEERADTSVFKTEKSGFKVQTAEEYLNG